MTSNQLVTIDKYLALTTGLASQNPVLTKGEAGIRSEIAELDANIDNQVQALTNGQSRTLDLIQWRNFLALLVGQDQRTWPL